MNRPPCRHWDRHRIAVSINNGFTTQGNGTVPVTIVLWRCAKCGAVQSQFVRGRWTLTEIRDGFAVAPRVAKAVRDGYQVAPDLTEPLPPVTVTDLAVRRDWPRRPADNRTMRYPGAG